jgi:hypothetical protein
MSVPPGTFLETVPGFVSNLIEHIDVLAFKCVLVKLFTEWSAPLPNWGPVIAILTTMVSRGGNAGYGALVVACEALLSDFPVQRIKSECLMLARVVLAFC